MVFLDRVPKPHGVGAEWLSTVTADRRMVGQANALAAARELALHVGQCGSGELPSPTDLARATKLAEDAAIEAVNALIYRGFIALIYRPRISFAVRFFCRPGPFQAAKIGKGAGERKS
jgi:hypothetical protein